MATKVASLYADVNANTSGFMSGMASVKGSLTSTASALSSFSSIALGVGAAVVGAGVLIGKAFEFGEAGAQILQTRDSFNSLATSLGQGPGLLQELQAATRGTVSEFDLMQSTSQLLMGTTGELGAKLADAAPQLAAIAQAAHDLNPAMGTTAEMYDRLSRGIKKAEPELLDEVGILMNLTQVYKDYAASHGITVTAMDKTMKTEAMLNAVLQQGTTLMQQAAGVNTSAADSFARLDAATTDLGNAFKEKLAPPLANAAEGALTLLTWSDKLTGVLSDHSKEVLNTAGSYQEYSTELWRAALAAGYWVDSAGDLRNQIGGLVQANYRLSDAEYATVKAMQSGYNVTAQLSGGLSRLDSATTSVAQTVTTNMQAWTTYGETLTATAEATHYNEQAMQTYGDRLTGLAGYYAELEAAEQQRIMTAGLMAGIQGTLGDATAAYQETIVSLTEQEALLTEELIKAQEQGYAPTSERITELNNALAENQEAQDKAMAALQETTAQLIYQQVAASLDTQSALDLARSMNILSEADYVVASSAQAIREGFVDLNNDGFINATEGANDLTYQLSLLYRASSNLAAQNITPTFENLATEMQKVAQADAAAALQGVAEEADPAASGASDVSDAAGDAAGNLSDTATSGEDAATALERIHGEGPGAASGISSAGGAARIATKPLGDAAAAAGDLASSLQEIPGRTSINVSVTGVTAAIAEISRLAGAINALPTEIVINARVESTGGSSGGGGGGGGGGPNIPERIVYPSGFEEYGQSKTTYSETPMIVNETYNVYDPLAATILAQNKRLETQRRLEAVMNG